MEFIKKGGSYAIVSGKSANFRYRNRSSIVPSKEVSVEGQGLTAVENIQ
jgi:hypothetical protein